MKTDIAKVRSEINKMPVGTEILKLYLGNDLQEGKKARARRITTVTRVLRVLHVAGKDYHRPEVMKFFQLLEQCSLGRLVRMGNRVSAFEWSYNRMSVAKAVLGDTADLVETPITPIVKKAPKARPLPQLDVSAPGRAETVTIPLGELKPTPQAVIASRASQEPRKATPKAPDPAPKALGIVTAKVIVRKYLSGDIEIAIPLDVTPEQMKTVIILVQDLRGLGQK